MGADSRVLSRGKCAGQSSRSQADPHATSFGSGVVDSEHRCAVAHASSGIPELQDVHRRFQQWCREEVLRKVLTDLANVLREEGEIDESECTRVLRVLTDRNGRVMYSAVAAAGHRSPPFTRYPYSIIRPDARTRF